ncbi:MAG: T9SS type A sorting domain-containing protein, partial [Draconibacterium sp.]
NALIKRISFFFCVAILFISVFAANAQSWSIVGSKAFSSGEAFTQSIVTIGETPYVAYMDRANDDKATVMKFDGESWVPVGSEGFTEGKASSLCLAASGQAPYIAFCDGANGNKASVMTYSGSEWVYVGSAGFTENIADVISFVISDGVPWIAFSDAAHSSKVTVMKYSGEWETVGEPGFSTGWMTNVVALAIENGTPYVAYRDYDVSYKASAMKFNIATSMWERLGTQGFSGGTHDAYHCIAVYGGIPYVASWGAEAKGTLYKLNGSDWAPLGSTSFSEDQANYLTVKITNNGVSYVVCQDYGNGKKATVRKFNGTTWEMVGEPASQGIATYTDIAISDNGILYLVFRDEYNMRHTTVMKYDLTSGISENQKDQAILNIYPNPASGTFTFELRGMEGKKAKIEITDLLGRKLFKEEVILENKNKVSLPAKENGMYLLHVEVNDFTFSKTLLLNR